MIGASLAASTMCSARPSVAGKSPSPLADRPLHESAEEGVLVAMCRTTDEVERLHSVV